MVGYERPCIAACFCIGNNTTNSMQKVISIIVIDEEFPPLDSLNHQRKRKHCVGWALPTFLPSTKMVAIATKGGQCPPYNITI